MRYFPFVKEQIHRKMDGEPFLTKLHGAIVPEVMSHERFFLSLAQHVRFAKGLPMFEALDMLLTFKKELDGQRELAPKRGYYAIEDDRAQRLQDVLANENVWEPFALPGLVEFFSSARAMTDKRPVAPAVVAPADSGEAEAPSDAAPAPESVAAPSAAAE